MTWSRRVRARDVRGQQDAAVGVRGVADGAIAGEQRRGSVAGEALAVLVGGGNRKTGWHGGHAAHGPTRTAPSAAGPRKLAWPMWCGQRARTATAIDDLGAEYGDSMLEALTGSAHLVKRSWADPGDQLGLGTLSKRGVRPYCRVHRLEPGPSLRSPARPTKGSSPCAAPAHSGNSLKGNLRSGCGGGLREPECLSLSR